MGALGADFGELFGLFRLLFDFISRNLDFTKTAVKPTVFHHFQGIGTLRKRPKSTKKRAHVHRRFWDPFLIDFWTMLVSKIEHVAINAFIILGGLGATFDHLGPIGPKRVRRIPTFFDFGRSDRDPMYSNSN